MTKRALLALLLAALVGGGAFAQQSLWSMGAGLVFDGGGIGSGVKETWYWSWQNGSNVIRTEESARHFGFGVWAFIDSTFLEMSVGLLRGSSSLDIDGSRHSGSFSSLDISLLGKLPFYLGGMEIFPLLGIGYSHVFSASLEDNSRGVFNDSHRFSTFRIKFGAGGDIDLRRDVFIRASLLGSYRYPPWTRRGDATSGSSGRSGSFGVTVKTGIGLRL